ncbi:hypothetical protein FXO37_21822 [Capsicum annuum]|nr:hypothetical protein FXO37_21822 [Capsicum annuum]
MWSKPVSLLVFKDPRSLPHMDLFDGMLKITPTRVEGLSDQAQATIYQEYICQQSPHIAEKQNSGFFDHVDIIGANDAQEGSHNVIIRRVDEIDYDNIPPGLANDLGSVTIDDLWEDFAISIGTFLYKGGRGPNTVGDDLRRRAVVSSLHKKYLSVIIDRVFCKYAERMVEKLLPDAISGSVVNMEANFSQLTLDVIGIALFNYNFDSLITESPVIDAVYTSLNETELRSTDLLPYWQAGVGIRYGYRSRGRILHDLNLKIWGYGSRDGSGYGDSDPSALEKAHEEVDKVLGGCSQTYEDMKNLKFITWCIIESL